MLFQGFRKPSKSKSLIAKNMNSQQRERAADEQSRNCPFKATGIIFDSFRINGATC
jgi:hypothetical protein